LPDPSVPHLKPLLSQIAELVTASSSLIWPLIFIVIAWLLRDRMRELLQLAINRIENASEIEIGNLKLRGAIISRQGDVIKTNNERINVSTANKDDLIKRNRAYSDSRNIFLVHTIKPSEPKEYVHDLRVFDVSIYVTSHKNRGRMNDIKKVTYYLGDKWGKGEFGSLFVIENGNDSFAFSAQMYGACVCLAMIEFHDGSTHETFRYLDVEMAPVYGISLSEARD
jgi:hypothetical protein